MEAFTEIKAAMLFYIPTNLFHVDENYTSWQKRVSSFYCIQEDILLYNGFRQTFISKV